MPADTPRSKPTVEMPRHLVVLLVGALVVCLVGLGYLIGRESGRTTAPAQSASAVTPLAEETAASSLRATPAAVAPSDALPAGPSAAVGAVPDRVSTTVPPQPRADARTLTTQQPPPTPTPVTPAPSAGQSSQQRDAVDRYFREIEAIDVGSGSVGGDPEAMAMAILGQATTGDTSAFDELADNQRAALTRLRAIRAPNPCREHHQRSITLLEQSIALLDRVKRGLASGNIGALSELSSEAERLKREAEQAESLARRIKQQFDIEP